jgi:muramidase (phage lysozyme)
MAFGSHLGVRTRNTRLTAAQRALLDSISETESRAKGYNALFGGGHFTDFSQRPNQGAVIPRGPNKGKISTASGRYQFNRETWEEQAARLGLTDFRPETQDLAALDLATRTYANKTGRDLKKDLENPKMHAAIGKALSGRWTSLPGGIEQARDYKLDPKAFAERLAKNVDYHEAIDQGAKPLASDHIAPRTADGAARLAARETTISMRNRRPADMDERQAQADALAARSNVSRALDMVRDPSAPWGTPRPTQPITAANIRPPQDTLPSPAPPPRPVTAGPPLQDIPNIRDAVAATSAQPVPIGMASRLGERADTMRTPPRATAYDLDAGQMVSMRNAVPPLTMQPPNTRVGFPTDRFAPPNALDTAPVQNVRSIPATPGPAVAMSNRLRANPSPVPSALYGDTVQSPPLGVGTYNMNALSPSAPNAQPIDRSQPLKGGPVQSTAMGGYTPPAPPVQSTATPPPTDMPNMADQAAQFGTMGMAPTIAGMTQPAVQQTRLENATTQGVVPSSTASVPSLGSADGTLGSLLNDALNRSPARAPAPATPLPPSRPTMTAEMEQGDGLGPAPITPNARPIGQNGKPLANPGIPSPETVKQRYGTDPSVTIGGFLGGAADIAGDVRNGSMIAGPIGMAAGAVYGGAKAMSPPPSYDPRSYTAPPLGRESFVDNVAPSVMANAQQQGLPKPEGGYRYGYSSISPGLIARVHNTAHGANDAIQSAAQGPGPFGMFSGWTNPQVQALAGAGGGFMSGYRPQGYATPPQGGSNNAQQIATYNATAGLGYGAGQGYGNGGYSAGGGRGTPNTGTGGLY